MRVCVIPSDMDAPGSYRVIWPAWQLREHGVEVIMPPYREKEIYLGERVRYLGTFHFDPVHPQEADLYVFQQWKERFFNEQGIRTLRANGSATSMDVDDNYINIPAHNPAFLGSHPHLRFSKEAPEGRIINRRERRMHKGEQISGGTKAARRYLTKVGRNDSNSRNRWHMLDIIQQVDLVTVSTPFLADVYRNYHHDIKVVRNSVDWDVWSDVTPQHTVQRDRPRIGWLNVAHAFRQADMRVIERPLSRYLKDHPDVMFVTNEEETHNRLGVPEEQRVTIGLYDFYDRQSGFYKVGEMTAQCDVGLVPMEMNDLNRGKSHLKGLEYNAAGIPFIASPTESYADYWCDGSNGSIAESQYDWYDQIDHYLSNDQARRTAGSYGRGKAQLHSLQNTWRRWYNVYADLLGDEHYRTARHAITVGAVQKFSELGKLLQIVADHQPRVIVEIGTARGGTFWAIAQTAPDDALLVSMDIPAGSPLDIIGGQDAYGDRDREKIREFAKPGQTVRLIDMDSQTPEALHALQDALRGHSIDLLFIDGDHRYEGVQHDYQTYRPLVREGGIIAFHDIVSHADKRVGVTRLWNEITPRNHTEELLGKENWGASPWGGIGVVHV